MRPEKDTWRELRQRLRLDLAFFRWLKQYLPRGLYGRALLILVLPVILTQAIATYIFYDRHWTTVTNRLAFALAGEISVIAGKMENGEPAKVILGIHDLAHAALDLDVAWLPSRSLAEFPERGDYASLRGRMLLKALSEKVMRPFALDLRHEKEWIAIYVQLPSGVLSVVAPERRIYSPTAQIFIIWMVGSAALLSLIAILFLRNQIRPIRRLADAAAAMGKGQDSPGFKPEGAREVRLAAINLMIMRDRLRRQLAQRTAMLNGVSHDLRTPLTRMKLQLALMPPGAETTGLSQDVAEMTGMVDAYLAFARGEEGEEPQAVEYEALLEEIVAAARRLQRGSVHLSTEAPTYRQLRPQAIRRAIGNLIGNAQRHGTEVWVTTARGNTYSDVRVDDDGPGIPAERREEVFRPFTRLDESRNAETGGVGLGLTIARDIARAHGGDVLLEGSPHGGLRAIFRLPL